MSVAVLLAVFGSVTPVGGGHGCRIRDRTGRGGTDRAGSFVGDRARRWHGNSIVDIPTATRGEAGSAAALSGGIGYTGKGAREGIVDDRAADLTWADVRHDNRVGVLCPGNCRCLAIIHRHLKVAAYSNIVRVGRAVVGEVRVGNSARHSYGCGVRQRTSGCGTKLAGSFVGDCTSRRQR